MTQLITILGEYTLEIILGGLIIFFELIGKPKSAEKCRKLKEKNVTQLERKQLNATKKMQKRQTKIDKLKKELDENA